MVSLRALLNTLLRPSEVARELGISAEWLREAERRGLLPLARRDINGWRFYSPEDLEEIRRRLFPAVRGPATKGTGDGQAEA